jgi:cyclopropane fatty-acyl-phospholipid synthase-like methyltransferase
MKNIMKNNYKYKKDNYNFWLNRLNSNKEDLVCTKDIILDRLEEEQIIINIKNNSSILELGCGNGFILKKILKKKKIKNYLGTDFVNELINNCKSKFNFKNTKFQTLDMTLINKSTFSEKYDYIISKRAIQNILSHKLQLEIIDNAGYFLKKNGLMILVESSATAQKNINNLRKKYKLSKIIPPFHNLFFNDNKIKKYKFKNVKLSKIENFSSNFYFISRIIYALYTKFFLKKNPVYGHPLNVIASTIKENLLNKDLSQIKTYFFRKK